MPLVRRVTFQAVTLRREATSIKENISLQQEAVPACPEKLDKDTDPPCRGQSDTALVTPRKAGTGTQPCS